MGFIIRVMVKTAFWSAVFYIMRIRNNEKCNAMYDAGYERGYGQGYNDGLYQNITKYIDNERQAKGDSDEC